MGEGVKGGGSGTHEDKPEENKGGLELFSGTIKNNLRYFAIVPYLNRCSVKVMGYKLYIFIGAFKDSPWN